MIEPRNFAFITSISRTHDLASVIAQLPVEHAMRPSLSDREWGRLIELAPDGWQGMTHDQRSEIRGFGKLRRAERLRADRWRMLRAATERLKADAAKRVRPDQHGQHKSPDAGQRAGFPHDKHDPVLE